jgi:predicted phosphodiesterase
MKILCISDQIDPLVYSNSIKTRFADVDLILSAGDLPLDYLDFVVSNLNKPLVFVFGNHHTKKIEDDAYGGCGCVHAGSKVVHEEGVIIAGLGGCLRYNNGANQFS